MQEISCEDCSMIQELQPMRIPLKVNREVRLHKKSCPCCNKGKTVRKPAQKTPEKSAYQEEEGEY